LEWCASREIVGNADSPTMLSSRPLNHYAVSRRVSIRAHADAELTQAQLEELANNLADKRRELAATLDTLNQQITMKEDCSLTDVAEAVSLREEIARASGIADQHNQTIADIDQALQRLETGSYGVSEISGEPIPYERLLLIPWARTGSGD
jgi:RNA polymerase-binding transcription factor